MDDDVQVGEAPSVTSPLETRQTQPLLLHYGYNGSNRMVVA